MLLFQESFQKYFQALQKSQERQSQRKHLFPSASRETEKIRIFRNFSHSSVLSDTINIKNIECKFTSNEEEVVFNKDVTCPGPWSQLN